MYIITWLLHKSYIRRRHGGGRGNGDEHFKRDNISRKTVRRIAYTKFCKLLWSRVRTDNDDTSCIERAPVV